MTPEPAYVPEEPRYKLRWVLTLPRINPLIARDCMAAPVPRPNRLAHQVVPHTRIRGCCWHHSIDWRQASAAAVTLARQMIREHITGEEEMFDRAFTLIRALGLPELQRQAVEALLCSADGIEIEIQPATERDFGEAEQAGLLGAGSAVMRGNLPDAFAAGVDPERDDLCLAGRLRAAGMVARDALCEPAVSRVSGQWPVLAGWPPVTCRRSGRVGIPRTWLGS